MPDHGKENPASTSFDNQLIELESVDSTNNYAMACIHEGLASHGMIYMAHHQWAGKGQRGRTWISEPGQNLMMSLIIKPSPLNINQQFLFSAAIALAILDIMEGLESKNWKIKWPNDIYWNDRKAGGILIENVISGRTWSWAVVGIGLNLNQLNFPDEIPNAVSLQQITGAGYKPADIARVLANRIRERISYLNKTPGQILLQFNDSLYKKDQIITFKKNSEIFVSAMKGVDKNGMLITENGIFKTGEIEWMTGG